MPPVVTLACLEDSVEVAVAVDTSAAVAMTDMYAEARMDTNVAVMDTNVEGTDTNAAATDTSVAGTDINVGETGISAADKMDTCVAAMTDLAIHAVVWIGDDTNHSTTHMVVISRTTCVADVHQ